MSLIHRGTSRYATWTRGQASAVNCGGGAAGGGLLVLGVCALLTAAYWAVIWPVLVMIFWGIVATAGLCVLGLIAWGIAAGVAAHRRAGPRQLPPRPVCADCGTRPAAAEVTYANGRRGDTVYTCEPCWQAEEARAASPPEFAYTTTLLTSRLPAYHEVAPEPARPPEISRPAAPAPPGVRVLPDADAECPVAPDNVPAADAATASDLAAVLARTGQWSRQHP